MLTRHVIQVKNVTQETGGLKSVPDDVARERAQSPPGWHYAEEDLADCEAFFAENPVRITDHRSRITHVPFSGCLSLPG